MSQSRRTRFVVFAAALIGISPLASNAASKSWIGGADNWNNPVAWSPAGVPGDGDFVGINTNGDVVNYIQPAAVSLGNIGLGATTGATLNQTQDTLTVSTMSLGGGSGTTGTYNFSGGTLNIGGITINTGGVVTGSEDITIGTGLHFVGGQMSGAGETTVPSSAVLNFLGTSNHNVSRIVRNYGTGTWAGTGSISGTGRINNESVFNITNNGGVYSAASFVNNGTLQKMSGSGTTTFGGASYFNSLGTVIVDSGTMLVINCDVAQHVGSSLTHGTWNVAGELQINSGSNIDTIDPGVSVKLDGASSLFAKIDTLVFNLGSFEVTNGRQFTTVGVFNNSGTLKVGTGAKLTVTTGLFQHSVNTLTAGTYVVTGELVIPGGPITTNQADFTLDSSASVCTAIDGLSDNQGTFRVTGGRVFTSSTLDNSGTMNVGPSGTVNVTTSGTQSGTVVIGTSSTLSYSGSSTQSGSVSIAGTLSLTGGTHTLSSPTFSGGGTLTIGTTATVTSANGWTGPQIINFAGGTITGAGHVLVSSGQQFRMLSGTSRSLNTTIKNSGTVTWQGNTGLGGSGIIDNLAGGLFQIQNTPGAPAMGISQFNNAGTIVKTGSGGGLTSNFGGTLTFNNTGTVDVQSGTLNVNSTINQATTSTLTGGTWKVSGSGVLALSGPTPSLTTIGPAATVQLSGSPSTFSKINTLADNQGSFTITSGRSFTTAGALANSGSLTIGPTSTLVLSGTLHETGTLAVDPSGAINLANQKIVSTDSLATVTTMVTDGRLMTTSDFAGLTTVAVSPATVTPYVGGSFGGVSVAATDVLAMYTLAGDVDLDTDITADDYFRIDSNYGKVIPGPQYHNGDFNYDGVIDGDDYSAIDASFAGQGGFSPAPPAGVTAVPEPTSAVSIAVLALAAGTLRQRRRDRRVAI